MSAGKPPWWRAFDRVERAVGKPLEDIVADPRYVDVMVAGMKVQRVIGGAVKRVAGGAAERVLHVAQVPTRGDVRQLNRQLTTLAREVHRLTEQQEPQLPPPAKARRPKASGDGARGTGTPARKPARGGRPRAAGPSTGARDDGD